MQTIREDIDRHSVWADTWLKEFNFAKRVVLQSKTGRLPTIKGQLLPTVNENFRGC